MCTRGVSLQFNSVDQTKLFVFDFSTDAAPLLCCLIEGGVDFTQLLFLKGTVKGKG